MSLDYLEPINLKGSNSCRKPIYAEVGIRLHFYYQYACGSSYFLNQR